MLRKCFPLGTGNSDMRLSFNWFYLHLCCYGRMSEWKWHLLFSFKLTYSNDSGVIRPPRNCPGVILIAAEIPTITYMFLYSAVDFSVHLLYKIFVCVNVWTKAELLLFVSNVTFGLATKLINTGWTLNKILFITKSYKQRDKLYYDKWWRIRVGLPDVDLRGGNLRYPDSGTSTLPASAHLPELLISPYIQKLMCIYIIWIKWI